MSRGSDFKRPGTNSITFDGLTDKELSAFLSFEIGESYLRVIGGRLHAYTVREPLPDAEADPLLSPHWSTDGTVKQFGGPPPGEGWHSPGIIITAVGAGSRDGDEGRLRSQRTLVECGFTCLRSPRGDDGRFWEQWVLHFMAAAEGPLKEHLQQWRSNHRQDSGGWFAEVEEVARFITRDLGVRYGSLDITIQRWCLSLGE